MGSLGQLYIVPLLFLYGLFTQPCSIGCGLKDPFKVNVNTYDLKCGCGP